MIGQNIRRRRKAAQWSQAALAARIGLARQRISDYENGRNTPTGAELYVMAMLLGCTVGELCRDPHGV